MKRFKWFKADWPITMQEISARLKRLSFDIDAESGFVLDRVRSDGLEGRYAERHAIKDHTVDPFGNEYQFDRIEFDQWQFRLSATQPGFELVGSTRGSRSLATRLSEICDFRLALTEYTLNPMNWLEAVASELESDGYVDIVQIGAIDLENGTTGRSTISGRRDVKDAVNKLVGSRSYSMLKVRYKVLSPVAGTITLSNTASAAVKLTDPSLAEDCVRRALQKIW